MSDYYRSSNPSEYGGGGSTGANYYDTSADFSSDYIHAVSQAQYHHGDSGEDNSSFFNSAVKFLGEHKDRFANEDVDEEQAVKAHQSLYGGGGGGQKHDADSLGAGAAMQALKMFMGDEGKSGSGGHDQNKLIGIAMAQAGKLWDQQNQHGNVTTDKQSAINSAAKMALKMYMKGGSGGSAGGLGGLGGLVGRLGGESSGGSNLMNLAGKFLSK